MRRHFELLRSETYEKLQEYQMMILWEAGFKLFCTNKTFHTHTLTQVCLCALVPTNKPIQIKVLRGSQFDTNFLIFPVNPLKSLWWNLRGRCVWNACKILSMHFSLNIVLPLTLRSSFAEFELASTLFPQQCEEGRVSDFFFTSMVLLPPMNSSLI